MILNKCITEYHSTGPCSIDIEKAVKCWTKRCVISRWNEEYTIVRYTHKRHIAMKVRITSAAAKQLINKLGLEEHKSAIYSSGSSFLIKGVTPREIGGYYEM